jgi:hypothetical protein
MSLVTRRLLAVSAAGALVALPVVPAHASRGNANDKQTICHATNSNTNPYVLITPNKNGGVSGHAKHTGPIWNAGLKAQHISWGDIIPPFDYKDHGTPAHYPGLNWTAEGQAIFDNGCAVPSGGGTTGGTTGTTTGTTTSGGGGGGATTGESTTGATSGATTGATTGESTTGTTTGATTGESTTGATTTGSLGGGGSTGVMAPPATTGSDFTGGGGGTTVTPTSSSGAGGGGLPFTGLPLLEALAQGVGAVARGGLTVAGSRRPRTSRAVR